MLVLFKMYFIVSLECVTSVQASIFNIFTGNVSKNFFFKKDLIEMSHIKMFEIYKNVVYDDILHSKFYLDTIKNFR